VNKIYQKENTEQRQQSGRTIS